MSLTMGFEDIVERVLLIRELVSIDGRQYRWEIEKPDARFIPPSRKRLERHGVTLVFGQSALFNHSPFICDPLISERFYFTLYSPLHSGVD